MQVFASVSELEMGLIDLLNIDEIYVADDGAAGGGSLGGRSLKTIWKAHRVARHQDVEDGVSVEAGCLMINIDDTSDLACVSRVKDLVASILGEDASSGDF